MSAAAPAAIEVRPARQGVAHAWRRLGARQSLMELVGAWAATLVLRIAAPAAPQ